MHPDDEYALEHEGEYGKNECWYVVQAEPGAKIVYGHTAMTPEEFAEKIDNEAWSDLFTEVPVKAGDFFDVPSGTIHAIGGGIVILETQQNSDTTYRVYDYNRTDDAGNPRPLHIQQTKDVTTIPHSVPTTNQQVVTTDTGTRTTFVENKFFTVWKYDINGDYSDALFYLSSCDGVRRKRYTHSRRNAVSNPKSRFLYSSFWNTDTSNQRICTTDCVSIKPIKTQKGQQGNFLADLNFLCIQLFCNVYDFVD